MRPKFAHAYVSYPVKCAKVSTVIPLVTEGIIYLLFIYLLLHFHRHVFSK